MNYIYGISGCGVRNAFRDVSIELPIDSEKLLNFLLHKNDD